MPDPALLPNQQPITPLAPLQPRHWVLLTIGAFVLGVVSSYVANWLWNKRIRGKVAPKENAQ